MIVLHSVALKCFTNALRMPPFISFKSIVCACVRAWLCVYVGMRVCPCVRAFVLVEFGN